MQASEEAGFKRKNWTEVESYINYQRRVTLIFIHGLNKGWSGNLSKGCSFLKNELLLIGLQQLKALSW
jgi:hypothetical protein